MLHQSNIQFKYSAPLRDLETSAINGSQLGSGLIDQSQKMTAAAMQMAEKNV